MLGLPRPVPALRRIRAPAREVSRVQQSAGRGCGEAPRPRLACYRLLGMRARGLAGGRLAEAAGTPRPVLCHRLAGGRIAPSPVSPRARGVRDWEQRGRGPSTGKGHRTRSASERRELPLARCAVGGAIHASPGQTRLAGYCRVLCCLRVVRELELAYVAVPPASSREGRSRSCAGIVRPPRRTFGTRLARGRRVRIVPSHSSLVSALARGK